MLIAKRPEWKKNDAGKWTESVVGTNEEGETYSSNAVKEVYEELGLSIQEKDLFEVNKEFIKIREWQLFGQMFIYRYNSRIQKLNISSEEVPEVKWISDLEINNIFINNPNMFVDGMEKYYSIVLKKYKELGI